MRLFCNRAQLFKTCVKDLTVIRRLEPLMSSDFCKFRGNVVASVVRRSSGIANLLAPRHIHSHQSTQLKQSTRNLAAGRIAAASTAVSEVERQTRSLQQRRLKSGAAANTCSAATLATVGPAVVDASLLLFPSIHDAPFPQAGVAPMKPEPAPIPPGSTP